jgi:hypothetical protein
MLKLGPVRVVKRFAHAGEEHEVVLVVRPPDAAYREEAAAAAKAQDPAAWTAATAPDKLAAWLDGWEGLGDADGRPLPCTPEAVREVCGRYPAVHAALAEALYEALPVLVRGNSKPSPGGSRTGGGARPAAPAPS